MDSSAAHCYRAYLLRLWRTSNDEAVEWRASLEDPHTGERHGFATLKALFAFLQDQTGEPPAASNSPDNAHPLE